MTLSCCGNMASVERCTVLITLVLLVQCGEHIVNGVISDVRLVGGPTPNKGTVEIRQDNGSWETTCGVNLGIHDVIVICRQLGFTGASRAIENTSYAQNSPPTSVLNCGGDEANLTECTLLSSSTCSTAGAASCHGEGYLGCFMDNANDRVFAGNYLVNDPDITIPYCLQFCNDTVTTNYVYAGVEAGDECFCGEASENYSRHGVVSHANCQVPCEGDPTDSCGGNGYIAVFIIPNIPSTSTAVPTLTSTYQSTVRRTTVNIQSPTTPGVGSTDSMQIMTLSPASASASASPPVMTTMGTSQVPPRNGDNQNNTGLYAGVAGGVVAIVIIVVIVIVVVLLMRKRSRRQQKDGLQSHDMTVMQPASPNGTQDNLYHDMFQDNSDETPHGLQLPDPPTDGDVTYYSSVRDHALPEGDATSYSSVKDQKSKNTDSKLNNTMPSDQNDGFPEKRVSRPPPNGDVEAMYAMPDKPRKSQGEEDFGALYAKPDKTGKGGDGQGSEDFGALYAMPDKSRGVPEGREDVNQVGPESEGNSGEGLYSLADDDTGLYAMSTAPGHTVNNDDNEYGTVMVDNELYAM